LLGRDADRVSRDETAQPDGFTDVHFRVKVKFPQPVEFRSITLRAAGEGDRAVEGPGYGTLDPEGWLLAVERDGQRLNEGFTNRLAAIDREATLDLYIGDNGTLDLGNRIILELTLEDGTVTRRAFTLAPPANRLLGLWQVHCDPGSPDAFEPMSLSGRLWLDLAEDGRATGEVQGIPLTGTLAGDSIRMTGTSTEGSASLTGEITRPSGRRSAPSANGWIELQPARLTCTSGPWWTE
jgi:hypothetical protein